MGKIYDNVIQLIGNTPILHLHKMEEEEGLEANIYAKVEGFNPGGSVKDRAALNMIEAAEKEGKLKPGGRIVEGTSGNTGIGIALVSAVKNYHATICMQEGTSAEKIKILKAYGAEVELTPKNEGFGRAGGRAKEMEEEEGAFRPAQGENPPSSGSSYFTYRTGNLERSGWKGRSVRGNGRNRWYKRWNRKILKKAGIRKSKFTEWNPRMSCFKRRAAGPA